MSRVLRLKIEDDINQYLRLLAGVDAAASAGGSLLVTLGHSWSPAPQADSRGWVSVSSDVMPASGWTWAASSSAPS
eukprot:9359856-Pyramimonas_sp.AAC.3